jgi:hypothetical protein
MTRAGALQRLWRLHRRELLPDFIRAHPGRRPAAWWRCDAPEPSRRRLGGVGTPCHEVLAYAEVLDLGIPRHWINARLAAYYRGEARDVHGEPIGVEYRGSGFRGVAIDPRDPPRYESEAAYLKRHGLLSAEERARLTPADFAPVVLKPNEDEQEDPDDAC